jgi:hypothetical protein
MSTLIIRDIPAPFAFDTLSRIRLVTPLLHFEEQEKNAMEKNGKKEKNKKVIQFHSVHYDRDRGYNRRTHYPGKWIFSVRVRTEYPVQPLQYLSISKPYQLSSTDPPVSTVG